MKRISIMLSIILYLTFFTQISCFIQVSYGQTNDDIYKKLHLTEEEIEYLDNNKTFYYAIETNYAPIEYLGKNGQPKGIGIEYLRKASELLGIEFILYAGAENLNWEDCLKLLKNKKIDLLPTVSYTDTRAKYISFTGPYFSEKMVVIGNTGSKVILKAEDLKGKTLAFTKGHWQNEYINTIIENAHIINTDNIKETLDCIENKKAEYTFLDNTVYIYYLQKEEYKNLHVAGKLDLDDVDIEHMVDMVDRAHRIGVNTDKKILGDILDKVIDYVPKEDIFRNTFYVEEQRDLNKNLLIVSSIVVGILFIIILLLFRRLFSLYRYKKNIRENKEMLIENLSHDLKTPLAALKVNIGLLKKGIIKKQDFHRYYEKLDKNVDRLNQIITDLYNISDIKEDIINTEKNNVSIYDFLYEIYEQNVDIFQQNNRKLKFTAPHIEKDNTKILIDTKTMYRAIMNLLSNALRFTDVGGIVEIAYIVEHKRVIISVKDHGIGIDKKDIPHIFDRFYQVEKNSLKPTKGIGLSITKDIVKFHNGSIKVFSEKGKYTEFKIYLPNSRGR